MAPSYKLYYFDGRGAAEIIRLLFKYGNIGFEDVRIKHSDWPQHKPNAPFGVLPVLECNDKKVGESLAIARYVAKQVGLVGENDWENLEIDCVVDTMKDITAKFRPILRNPDEASKRSQIENFLNETLPFYLQRFEALAQQNDGYLVINKLTWADVLFTHLFTTLRNITKGDILDKYPKLKALREKVNSIPAIKKWIEERPKTDS